MQGQGIRPSRSYLTADFTGVHYSGDNCAHKVTLAGQWCPCFLCLRNLGSVRSTSSWHQMSARCEQNWDAGVPSLGQWPHPPSPGLSWGLSSVKEHSAPSMSVSMQHISKRLSSHSFLRTPEHHCLHLICFHISCTVISYIVTCTLQHGRGDV